MDWSGFWCCWNPLIRVFHKKEVGSSTCLRRRCAYAKFPVSVRKEAVWFAADGSVKRPTAMK